MNKKFISVQGKCQTGKTTKAIELANKYAEEMQNVLFILDSYSYRQELEECLRNTHHISSRIIFATRDTCGNYKLQYDYFDKVIMDNFIKYTDVSEETLREEDYEIITMLPILKPITSLIQFEEVRKEMCEKYDTNFHITNKGGNWKIIFDGIAQIVGYVDSSQENIAHITNFESIGSYENNTDAKCGEYVYFDWENGIITDNPFRAINLEKEGYELKL